MITTFTPVNAAIGGALIGLAAVLLMYGNARIAGISGIAWASIKQHAGERIWRVLFLVGLVMGASLWFWLNQESIPLRAPISAATLVVAGFLVGLGTGISNGCTSGHGICGLARFSKRSLVAVVAFMAAGILTTTVIRHVWL